MAAPYACADHVGLPRDPAAVEARGVVGGHGPVVVPAVVVDEPHPGDRPPRVVQPSEGACHPGREAAVHHHLARLRPAVEVAVGQAQVAQVAQRHRAARSVAGAHPLGQRRADAAHRRGVRRVPGLVRPALRRQAGATPEVGPAGDGRPAGRAGDGPRAPAGGDPGRRPRVVDDPVTVHAQRQDAGVGLAVVVPEEVAEPVADIGVARPAGAAQHVGVAAHHDVGPGVGELAGEEPLPLRGAGLVLASPVQVDDDDVVDRGGRADGPQQRCRLGLARGGHARVVGTGRPHVAAALAEHRVGREEGEVDPALRHPVRPEGRGLVAAGADDLHRAASGSERVGQPGGTVVAHVVVGDAHHVDTGAGEHVEGTVGGPEVVAVVGGLELLGVAATPIGDRGLQVEHRDVRVAQRGGDRSQAATGTPQQPPEVGLEVHVAREGQGDLTGGLVEGGRLARRGVRSVRRVGCGRGAARQDEEDDERGRERDPVPWSPHVCPVPRPCTRLCR